jgi:hypothetical protein
MIHPDTAFYLGYNSNLENLDFTAISNHSGFVRNYSFLNDGRTLYAKLSYLFRF